MLDGVRAGRDVDAEPHRSNDGYSAMEADGTPAFLALLLAVKAALASQGVASRATNKPHITLSYWGSIAGSELVIDPIEWPADQILIIKGSGHVGTYHYDVKACKTSSVCSKATNLACFEKASEPCPNCVDLIYGGLSRLRHSRQTDFKSV